MQHIMNSKVCACVCDNHWCKVRNSFCITICLLDVVFLLLNLTECSCNVCWNQGYLVVLPAIPRCIKLSTTYPHIGLLTSCPQTENYPFLVGYDSSISWYTCGWYGLACVDQYRGTHLATTQQTMYTKWLCVEWLVSNYIMICYEGYLYITLLYIHPCNIYNYLISIYMNKYYTIEDICTTYTKVVCIYISDGMYMKERTSVQHNQEQPWHQVSGLLSIIVMVNTPSLTINLHCLGQVSQTANASPLSFVPNQYPSQQDGSELLWGSLTATDKNSVSSTFTQPPECVWFAGSLPPESSVTR